MFVFGGGSARIDIGDTISKSARFRGSATAKLTRSQATAGTSTQKFTWSFWVKRGEIGVARRIMGVYAGSADTSMMQILFGSGDDLRISSWVSNWRATTAVFRDPSAWYHIVVAFDLSLTIPNNVRVYVNGNEITSFTTSTNPFSTCGFGQNPTTYIVGDDGISGTYFDGHLAMVHQIDGQQLTPSSFGRFSADTGAWVPKNYTGTYGNHGYKLAFASVSTQSEFGTDTSGNGLTFTVTNLSATAGNTYDWMSDTPTNNHCTWNPTSNRSTLSEANLYANSGGAGGYYTTLGTIPATSEKIYFEVELIDDGINARYGGVGVVDPTLALPSVGTSLTNTPGTYSRGWIQFFRSSVSVYGTGLYNNNAAVNTTARATTSGTHYAMVALDATNGNLWIGYDGTWFSGNPATGSTPYATGVTGPMIPFVCTYNDGSNANLISKANFGQRAFAYSPPTGFSSLCTGNLSTPTIIKGNKFFDINLRTGTGANGSVTGIAFQPDLVWNKTRNNTRDHRLVDSVRGATKELYSSSTSQELTDTAGLISFNTDGYSFGTSAGFNISGETQVSWMWKKTPSIGFDIQAYNLGGVSVANFNHSLGVTPEMIIYKDRTSAPNWVVMHKNLANMTAQYLNLNNTNAVNNLATAVNAPTSTQFSCSTGIIASTTNNFVAYLFASVTGFSRIGTFTGNGSTDGPFVWCGFRPRFIMYKNVPTAGNNWFIHDTLRDTYNIVGTDLYPNAISIESTGNARLDILSNGFKIRIGAGSNPNVTNEQYIFAAFAELPFKYANAR